MQRRGHFLTRIRCASPVCQKKEEKRISANILSFWYNVDFKEVLGIDCSWSSVNRMIITIHPAKVHPIDRKYKNWKLYYWDETSWIMYKYQVFEWNRHFNFCHQLTNKSGLLSFYCNVLAGHKGSCEEVGSFLLVSKVNSFFYFFTNGIIMCFTIIAWLLPQTLGTG